MDTKGLHKEHQGFAQRTIEGYEEFARKGAGCKRIEHNRDDGRN